MFSMLLAAICNSFTIYDTFTLRFAIISFFLQQRLISDSVHPKADQTGGHLPETGGHV